MTQITLYAAELAELEEHEKEMEKAAGLVRSNLMIFWQHLAEIHESECWKARHSSFDAYCEGRWRFTGARGRQFIEADGVAKNLSEMTEADRFGTFLFEYLTESHTRVLKSLSPDNQRLAWQAATASGEPPTAKTLATIVNAIQEGPTPDDIYAMGREEQHATLKGLEDVAESAATRQAEIAVTALAMKRLRAVSFSIRDPKFNGTFTKGRIEAMDGGIAAEITDLQRRLLDIHERLTAPLLDTDTNE